VEDVRAEGCRPMKIEGKTFFLKDKLEMYGTTFSRKYGIGEMEKQGEKK